jgi:hypothetical protein
MYYMIKKILWKGRLKLLEKKYKTILKLSTTI